MGTTQTKWKYLERDPKSAYRQLSIKGRRIKARTLYGQRINAEEPRTVEQIAEDYNLPTEAVREAVAYCQSDPPEIREDAEREEAIMRAKGMLEPGYKSHGRPKVLTPEQRARLPRK
jgi:uncharacterized protein (DUF433 family)